MQLPKLAPIFVGFRFFARQFGMAQERQPRMQSLSQMPLTVQVLSYNIHHAEGVDGKLGSAANCIGNHQC